MLRADHTPPTGGRAAAEARRDEYIDRVRIRHVIRAIRTAHYGDVCSQLRGTRERGLVLSTDNADAHVVAWSPEGVVAIAYDDDGAMLFGDRDCTDVEAVLADLPASLAPLAPELAKAKVEGREVTAARWIEVTDAGPRLSSWHDEDSEQLALYERPADAWAKSDDAPDERTLVAFELTRSWTGERRVVSADESRMLLAPPAFKRGVPANPANVKRAVALLKQAGIDWPTGVADAERLALDDSDNGYALIDAVAAGDAAAVEALLARGANIEKLSREGQLPSHPMGRETPLAVAARMKDLALAKRLLDAGASPNVLQAAAFGGSRAMCELLIERGASSQGLFEAGIRRGNGSAEVVELALDLGLAKPLVPGWYQWLRQTCLSAGRKDVLERCPGYEEMERRYQEMHAAELVKLRSQAAEAVFYVWMRHIMTAVRSLHFDVTELSFFEGSARAGRYAFEPNGKERHVVAWNEHGVVMWASVPFDGPRAAPVFTPMEAFTATAPASLPPGARLQSRSTKAPPELLRLVENTSKWERAPAELTDWKWVFPAGAERTDIFSMGLSTGESPVQRYGKYYDGHTIPGTDNWPREAYALDRALAKRIEQIVKASMEGPYEITPDDDALIREKQPKSRGFRPEAIPRAVEMLAALGIGWVPAS